MQISFIPRIEGINEIIVVDLQEGGNDGGFVELFFIFSEEIIKESQCVSNNFLANNCILSMILVF